MLYFKQLTKDNLIFLLVSFVPYVATPAILHAQSEAFNPAPFVEPLKLSRGDLSPKYSDGLWLSKDDYCDLFLSDWGWSSCEGYDAVVIGSTPGTDSLLIESANSEGFVKFDDWQSADRDDEIAEIEESLRIGSENQSKKTGTKIEFAGWRVYPTLDTKNNLLYYATDVSFDGHMTTNITASLFDRKGCVTFAITPDDSNLKAEQIKEIITDNVSLYAPSAEQNYGSYVTGDKVAAVGALGVLAALVGVKYGKAATTGILVTIALLAKKFIFLLIIPFVWLFGKFKTMFGRKE